MAAGTEVVSGETAVVEVAAVHPAAVDGTVTKNDAPVAVSENDGGGDVNSGADGSDSSSVNSSSKSDMQMHDFVDMLKKLKLNPLAKEFFPSTYPPRDQMMAFNLVPVVNWDNNGFPFNGFPNNNIGFPNNHRRKRSGYGQGRRRFNGHGNGNGHGHGNGNGHGHGNGRALRAQREDSIRRTVYVSDIDHNVTEEQLAGLFSSYGQVVDCRVCGDPHSRLRFAFVEFADEYSARGALNLGGTMLGFSPVKVLPSKTAILPVNPTFLPRSEDEREMCARTVYCTNIDKKVTQVDVKVFFENRCGEVSRLRLLGDQIHSTRIAFVEFTMAESAILALDCCGEMLGSQRVRVSPSKTPVRPRLVRPMY